jgi:hypothetical protein
MLTVRSQTSQAKEKAWGVEEYKDASATALLNYRE